jgi:hypothetical protein
MEVIHRRTGFYDAPNTLSKWGERRPMLEITPFPNSPLNGVRRFLVDDRNEVIVDGEVDQISSVVELHSEKQEHLLVSCLEFIDMTGRHFAVTWTGGKLMGAIHDVDRRTCFGMVMVSVRGEPDVQGELAPDLILSGLDSAARNCNCNCNCNCCNCNCNCNSDRWRIYAKSLGREALYSCNCNCNCNCVSGDYA